jgi:hypothetical protein
MARKQHGHDFAHRGPRFFAQYGIVIVGDRVLDHRERVALQAIQVADGLRGAREAIGNDGDGRDTEPFCLNRVVQTARRAAASIADRGEDRVRAAHLHQHRLRHRPRRVGLAAADAFAHAVLGLEHFLDEIEQPRGADFGVVYHADDSAIE